MPELETVPVAISNLPIHVYSPILIIFIVFLHSCECDFYCYVALLLLSVFIVITGHRAGSVPEIKISIKTMTWLFLGERDVTGVTQSVTKSLLCCV